MKMLNIAVCDDDIQTTGRMETLIQKIQKGIVLTSFIWI